jgi:hypothetical protein
MKQMKTQILNLKKSKTLFFLNMELFIH